MNANQLSFALSFLGIAIGMSLGGDDPSAQLRAFVLWGMGTLGLVSGLRHILAAGALRGEREDLAPANVTFFEWEAGFANLAFGACALLTTLGDWGVRAMAVVPIAYAIYLTGAAFTHILASVREGNPRKSISFVALTILLVAVSAWRVGFALAA